MHVSELKYSGECENKIDTPRSRERFWCQTFEFDIAYEWAARINNIPRYVCIHAQLSAYRSVNLKRSLWSKTNRGQSDASSWDPRTTFAQRFRATQNTEAFTSILMRNPHTPPTYTPGAPWLLQSLRAPFSVEIHTHKIHTQTHKIHTQTHKIHTHTRARALSNKTQLATTS
jgi:hypothetical protein